MSQSVFLKVTSAFMVGGAMAKAGEIVEVTNAEAKDLLNRGKAVLAVLDPSDQLDDAIEVDAGETQPAETETQPAEAETQPAEGETQPAAEEQQAEQPAAEEQPAAPAPAKRKGGNKKGK